MNVLFDTLKGKHKTAEYTTKKIAFEMGEETNRLNKNKSRKSQITMSSGIKTG